MTVTHPLDYPVRSALTGPHARFAERRGNVLRYQSDIAEFLAMPPDADVADWADAAALVGPGGRVPLAGVTSPPPGDWTVRVRGLSVQLTGAKVAGAPDPEAVPLGPADVAEMLDLVRRTKPGPFRPRTVELGGYLGLRRGGALVAMAGERVHPSGWSEISAVCTDDAWRGRGFASRLVRAVAANIRARGDIPYLNAAATNISAIQLYEDLGFRLRRVSERKVALVPATPDRR